MLPNFIGLGAQRSGTTWIYEMLKAHPDVYMSPEKEIDFFNEHYDKGLEWYENFFENSGEENLIGEFSPGYLSHELAPQRIKKIVPEAKLIISLRNPVDQIFSRYHYMVMRLMYNKSFEEALKEKPHILEGAFYYKYVKRYLEYFNRNQILILIYEDLRMDAQAFLQKIYSFLEIDNFYIPPNLNERVHVTRTPKSRYIETAMVIVKILLRKTGLYLPVSKLKGKGLVRKFKELNTQENKTFKYMDDRVRSQLNNVFENDKRMLSELLGRDLSFWN